MAEKKKPVSKIEPVEKKKISEKVYDFLDNNFINYGDRKGQQKHLCKPDLDDLGKSTASIYGTTEYLSPRDAVQLMYSNDPEVRKLQRRKVVYTLRGLLTHPKDPDDRLGWGAAMRKALQEGTDKPFDEVCKKGVPEFIYEPNVRYNEDRKPGL